MGSIDPADPDSPVPDFQGIDSAWFKAMNPEVRAFRVRMYAREIELSRALLARVDSGAMTPMEFSYRMTRLGVHDVKELCRLEMSTNKPCKIHELCWSRGEGHE